ncbi:MAG: alpha/beta hydrolase family protein, partial [Gemmatimonadales bacterium]
MRQIVFNVAASMLILGTAAAAGQTPSGSGGFMMRVGTTEIGSESFARHADTLRGTIRITNQPRLDYVAVLRPDLTLASLALSVFTADASPGAAPVRQMQFELTRDSVIGVVNGMAQHFGVAAGAVPFINYSWVMLELLTRRARAAGGTFSAPVWALSNTAPFTVVLTSSGSDSMSLVVAGQRMDLRVDAAGQLLGVSIASQGISVMRVDSSTAAGFATTTTPLPVGLHQRDITVPGPVPLPGTLTLPAGSGPFPIVVLVHGSGANDRDETIGPNKPFRDLAWGLAERGIAVLRYDKRGYVRPAWFAGRNFTVDDETVQDALSALTLARALPEADSTSSFLLGHSLGAIMAPRIAKADGKVAGLIIMAGATRMPLI